MKRFNIIILAIMVSASLARGVEDGKHLFILSGQSNMALMDPDISFTPTVEAAFGNENVIVVKDAASGQPISRWYLHASGARGDLYNRLLEKVQLAIDGETLRTVSFVWMQGESDVRETAPVYGDCLGGLIGHLKTDLQFENINFVIGRISDYGLLDTTSWETWNFTMEGWQMIRTIQVEYANSYPLGAWVDTDDLNGDAENLVNGLHYTVEGYEILGQRFAEEAIALINYGGRISIDFNVGAGPTHTGEPDNDAGLQLPGQVGAWNAFTVVASTGGEQSFTTTNGPTFTLNPGGGGGSFTVLDEAGSALREDIIAMNTANGHTSAVPWELTGLVAGGEYNLIFFHADNVNYNGAYTTIDGVAGATENTEKDYDFTGVVADGTGKISGTFDVPTTGWHSWSGLQFELTGVMDTTPPAIAALSPAHNATGAVSTAIVATFNENIVAGATGDIIIKDLDDGTTTQTIAVTDGTQVSIVDNILTIDPASDLTEGKSYAVQIAAGAVKDLSNNDFDGITNDTDWNFSVVSIDASLISIDFNLGSSATHTGEADNSAGLVLTGAGTWNAFALASSSGGEQSITTAEGPTFAINPGGGGTAFSVLNQIGTASANDLRGDMIAINVESSVPWELTGLDPNGLYSLVFFGHPQYVPPTYPAGSITTIDGVGTGATAGASEWDYDFTNVQAVGGKISGTFVSPAGWNTWSGLQFKKTGGGGSDITPPAIVSKDPDGVSDVGPAANLVATFNENIALKAGGTITITDTDDGTGNVVINLLDPTQVTVSGSDLIIDPGTDLEFGTNFEVVISNDAIEDTATTPNVYPGTTSGEWTFTTVVQDLTAPVITLKSPDDEEAGVSPDANVVATFDENILAGTAGDIIIKDLDDGTTTQTIAVTDGTQVSIVDNILTIDPASDLTEGKNYAVQITAGAVKDLSNNDFDGITNDTDWNFSVASINASLISIDFNVGASATHSGEPDNAAGLQLPGVGTWNALIVDGSVNEQSVTTVEGPTFTINPGGSGSPSYAAVQDSGLWQGDDLRTDFVGVRADYAPVAWELTGLVANGEYNLIFFGREYDGTFVRINGVLGATEATEKDSDFTGVVADGTGKISGTFDPTSLDAGHWAIHSGLQFKQTGTGGGGGNDFSDWIALQSVGGLTAFDDDFDKDGIGNGLENYFGTDPGVADAAGLSAISVTTGGSNTFVFRHPENATPADDLSAFYQWSTDLEAFHADGVTEGATTVDFSASTNDPLTGTTTVTATITGASPDSLFVRLGVTQNP